MKDFRTKLREYLAQEGISQRDAAKRMDISAQALSKMISPDNKTKVKPSTVTKALVSLPGFRYFATGRTDPDIGTQAADHFDHLMETHPYFRSKVEGHGQRMIIEFLNKK